MKTNATSDLGYSVTDLPPLSGVLSELVRVRNSTGQLSQYVAVMCGIRRALDDWIPIDCFDAFKSCCSGLGLHIAPDVVFEPVGDPEKYPSLSLSPTTKAFGKPYRPNQSYSHNATIHVFVGGTPEYAHAAWAAGWYSVIVGNRVIRKPLVDHYRFGIALGYPQCCVEFFRKYNHWERYNTLYEAVRSSRSVDWRANCFWKHTPMMLLFHMPCAFDCAPSVAHGSSLIDAIKDMDPVYAQRIEALHRIPVLSISERLAFALLGGESQTEDSWRYRGVLEIFAHKTGRDTRYEDLRRLLVEGDELRVNMNVITVLKRGRLIGFFQCYCDCGAVEHPAIIPFG